MTVSLVFLDNNTSMAQDQCRENKYFSLLVLLSKYIS